jgi:hypothetical protein
VPLRIPGAKQPSRQTREWMKFTEDHAIEAVLDDPYFYGKAVADVARGMPFDSDGQRVAACLAAGIEIAVECEIARSQVRRLVDEFYAAFEREAARESA